MSLSVQPDTGHSEVTETTTGGNTEPAYGWIPSPASAFSKAMYQPSQQISLSRLSLQFKSQASASLYGC